MKRFNQLPLTLVPILILPTLLFARLLVGGEVLYWGTAGLQFIPWRAYAWQMLLEGELPLWNALNGMGAPLMANYQSALFYPPTWITFAFAAVGGNEALAYSFSLLMVLHLMWGGWGMTRLLKAVGVSPLGQVVGAMAFAFGQYWIGRVNFFSMIWAGSWMPFVILGANQIASPFGGLEVTPNRSPDWLRWPLVLPVAMMLLAGHAQLSWYILMLAGMWVAVGGWRNAKAAGMIRSVGMFLAAGILAGTIAAVQLVPTAEFLIQSQRSAAVDYETALTYSLWPWRLLSLVAPDLFGNPGTGDYWGYANYWEDALYVGILPLLLAFRTLVSGWRKPAAGEAAVNRTGTALLWGAAIAGIILGLGKNSPIFPFLFEHIPSFNMFNAPSRFLVWTAFSLAMLAGLGTDRWKRPTGRGLYWTRLATAGGFAVTLGAGAAWMMMGNVSPSFIRAAALAGVWGLGAGVLSLTHPTANNSLRWRQVWMVGVVLWVGADLWTANRNLIPSVPRQFYAAVERTDIPSGGRVYLSPEDEYQLKFRRFLRFDDYQLIEDPQHVRAVLLPNLNLLDGTALVGNFDPFVPARYVFWQGIAQELSGEALLHWLRIANVSAVEQLDAFTPLGVRYEPIDGGSWLHWHTCAELVSQDEMHNAVTDAMKAEGEAPALIVEGDRSTRVGKCTAGQFKMITNQISAQMIRVTYEADTDGWLTAASVHYPGWRAELDGTELEISPAYGVFMTAAVPAGRHTITFRYQPASFYWGAGVTFFSLIFVITWGIILRTRKPLTKKLRSDYGTGC